MGWTHRVLGPAVPCAGLVIRVLGIHFFFLHQQVQFLHAVHLV